MAVKDVICTLNKLIETSKDGEHGYRACAKHLQSPALHALFLRRADDCQFAARELQMHIALLGGRAQTNGSAGGKLHRIWVALRGSVLGYNDQSVLGECERGQAVAVARYRAALKDDLPRAERRTAEYQTQGVVRHYEEIRNLRIRQLGQPGLPLSTQREPAM